MKNQKHNLVKKFIDDLPLPIKRISYFDAKVRGLYLEVTPSGIKSFYVRRKTKGKSEKFYIGRYPDITVEQARTKAISFHADLSNGLNPAEAKRNENDELTLDQLFAIYFERHLSKSRKTCQAIKKNFDNWFSNWQDRQLGTINRETVEALHGELAKTRGRYAANRAIELLRAIYNKAMLWKIWEKDNPARAITEFSEQSRERVLKESEIDQFFQALEKEPKDHFYDLVSLLILTGQRKSNVLGMRWQDIDMQAKTWSIPGELMKNGHPLTIALTEIEMTILNRRLEQKINNYVFPSLLGKSGHYAEPKRRWKLLLERAKITDFHVHDLRRTLASYMANSGANVALIQSALNHKDLQTTLRVYARTARRAELEAREKAHELMFSLIETKTISELDPASSGLPR